MLLMHVHNVKAQTRIKEKQIFSFFQILVLVLIFLKSIY